MCQIKADLVYLHVLLMINNYSYPNCLHLDHGVGEDTIIGLLNSIIDCHNSMNTCLETLTKSIKKYFE